MWEWIKQEYAYFHGTFHDSEVIAWSRFNVLVGSLWVALQGVDISPLIKDPKYLVWYIIFSNLVNEVLRRNRAEWKELPK